MRLHSYISSNKMAPDLLYMDYRNDKPENIVRKVYEKSKMLEFRDRLIQNVDPIYLEPAPAGPFSYHTHLMAPVKKFMCCTVETFGVNILLVLSSAIIINIMLYTQMLKERVRFSETLWIHKTKRSNQVCQYSSLEK